jgi:hypothetical protein
MPMALDDTNENPMNEPADLPRWCFLVPLVFEVRHTAFIAYPEFFSPTSRTRLSFHTNPVASVRSK